MKRKWMLILLLLLVLNNLTACNKDEILDTYDQIISTFGQSPLTNKRSLVGQKIPGKDEYTGQYQANYHRFNGTEYLFGGTTIDRKLGKKIHINCKIKKEEGSIKLGMISGTDKINIVSEKEGQCTKTIDLPQGGNYLYIEAEDFSGSINLNVE